MVHPVAIAFGTPASPYSYTVKWKSPFMTPSVFSGSQTQGVRENVIRTKNHKVKSWIPPAPYQFFGSKVTAVSFYYERKNAWVSGIGNFGGIAPPDYKYWGTRTLGGAHIADTSSSLENAMVNRALNGLGDPDRFSLGADLAERQQTIDLGAKLVKVLIDAYRAMRRRDYVAVVRILKQARYGDSVTRYFGQYSGNLWLGFFYGIKPLVQDLMAAFNLATKPIRSGYISSRAVGWENYGLPVGGIPYIGGIFQSEGHCRVGVEVKLYANLPYEATSLINSLGMDNPFVIGWEILPYSFIVDWLIPIGNVLSALVPPLGITFRAGYINRKVEADFKVSGLRNTGTGSANEGAQGSYPGQRYQIRGLYRQTYASMPLPRLYIKSPFSSQHVLNAVALITSSRRG